MFLDLPLEAWSRKGKINKVDLIKMKNFCSVEVAPDLSLEEDQALR